LVGGVTLSLDHLLTLLGRVVEHARVDLGLLVLETDVASENEGILHALLHVGVASTVVQHEALDELGVESRLVNLSTERSDYQSCVTFKSEL
jgi:hypothetical protein